MVTAGLKVLALLAGGTGLGAVLASFVDPVPRQRDPSPPQLSARPEFDPVQSYRFGEVGPEDLSPPSPADGYAPDGADSGEGVWQYPEPALAAWEPAPFPSVAELDARLAEDAALLGTGAEGARMAAKDASGPVSAPAAAEESSPSEARLASLY